MRVFRSDDGGQKVIEVLVWIDPPSRDRGGLDQVVGKGKRDFSSKLMMEMEMEMEVKTRREEKKRKEKDDEE